MLTAAAIQRCQSCPAMTDAPDLALMVLDEQDMFFERLAVFPAMQGRGVNYEADLPLLPDEFVDLRRDCGEIIGLQLR